MAILPEIPGLEVCVKVEGEIVPDFEKEAKKDDSTPVSEHPSGHFYVEAKSGARYRISLKMTDPFFDVLDQYDVTTTTMCVWLRVDGDHMRTWICSSLRDRTRPVQHELRHSLRISKHEAVQRDLVFGAVDKVEDASLARIDIETAIAKQIGSIEVLFELGHARKGQSRRGPKKSAKVLDNESNLEMAEEALKGLGVTHGTRLHGKAKIRKMHRRPFEATVVLGQFTFAYRSRDVLQSLSVIPRSAPERPRFADMSHDELVAFAERRWSASQDGEGEVTLTYSPTAAKNKERHGVPSNEPTGRRKRKRVEIDLTED